MKTGDRIAKPWGWEHILELNDRYCIKHLFIASGHRISKQYHDHKTETLMLVSGAVSISFYDQGNERCAPMVLAEPHHIPPGRVHRLRGDAPDGGMVLEVSTTELDDVVRLEDDYGRDGLKAQVG